MSQTRSAKHTWWIAFFFAFIAATAARGQAVIDTDTVFGLRLPAHIGGAERAEVRDFETTRPGLGYSVRYQLPNWTVDLYVYDLKLSSIPEDPKSKAVMTALDMAKKEVFFFGQRGDVYKNVMLKRDYAVRDSSGRTRFVCAMFNFHLVPRDADMDSYLCVTGWKGKFVKFRMTTPHNGASAVASRRFIEAWSNVLWPRA